MNDQTTSQQRFSNLILHGYWRSSCSWRCRLVLNFLKINFEYRAVHLVKNGGENHTEFFHKLNPAQKLPVLEFFDSQANKTIHLTESSAIIEFLLENFQTRKENEKEKEENKSGAMLLPSDPVLKAKTRTLYNHIACNIQPIQNLPVLNKVAESGVNKADWANYWISKGLEALEDLVKETKGRFCVGDAVTLADVYLVPQLYNARRFNVQMDKFPCLLEIEANLKDINEFVLASPENQPDAEK